MVLGPVRTDDPAYVRSTPIPAFPSIDIGSEAHPFRNLYLSGSVLGAGLDLLNNTYLQALNAAGTAQLDLLKADASNNTVLNALTAKKTSFTVNGSEIAKVDANGMTGSHFLLTDGSEQNYKLEVTAAGTAYQLTNSSAVLNFGTTDPVLVLDKAGTYLLFAFVNLLYNAATFAASRAVNLKLTRTNNTPGDISGAALTLATDIITTLTYTMGVFHLPPTVYTTANTDDSIQIQGDVAVVPTAGSLDAVAAKIVAVRLY